MVVVGADVAGFRLAEIRQAVQVGPVFQAWQFGPAVEIHGVAADVAHAVDQRRATQALAAATFHAAAVHVRLRVGLVGPVVAAALQREGQRGWHLGAEVHAVVRATGLEQQDSYAFVFGQAGRQGVTGRAGTDDDVVIFHGFLRKQLQASSYKPQENAVVRGSQMSESCKSRLAQHAPALTCSLPLEACRFRTPSCRNPAQLERI
ncbi:hypothetical protein D3C79_748170 [compost metagenome]